MHDEAQRTFRQNSMVNDGPLLTHQREYEVVHRKLEGREDLDEERRARKGEEEDDGDLREAPEEEERVGEHRASRGEELGVVADAEHL